MADEQDTQVSPAETEARGLGWVPEEEFRGDKAKWVDAETFVKRGKEQLPLLQAENRRLKASVASLTGKMSQLETMFEGAQESLVELKRFHEETFNARIKAEKERIREQIIKAREDDDVRAELDAKEKLDELNDEVRTVVKEAKKPEVTKPEPKPQPHAAENADSPEFKSWREANPWFLTDSRKASMVYGLAQQLRAENPTVVGKDFFDLLDEAIDEAMPSARPKTSKVNPARNGGDGGGGGGGGSGKGYASLPADAKEICDRQAKMFVGPNKLFKTDKEWQAHYSSVYFQKDAS
jgi:hypothetical protein